MKLDITRDDMELVWDPTPDPDDANRIKRGDAFCYINREGGGICKRVSVHVPCNRLVSCTSASYFTEDVIIPGKKNNFFDFTSAPD